MKNKNRKSSGKKIMNALVVFSLMISLFSSSVSSTSDDWLNTMMGRETAAAQYLSFLSSSDNEWETCGMGQGILDCNPCGDNEAKGNCYPAKIVDDELVGCNPAEAISGQCGSVCLCGDATFLAFTGIRDGEKCSTSFSCQNGKHYVGSQCYCGPAEDTTPSDPSTPSCFGTGHEIKGDEDGSECCDGGIVCSTGVFCRGSGFSCPNTGGEKETKLSNYQICENECRKYRGQDYYMTAQSNCQSGDTSPDSYGGLKCCCVSDGVCVEDGDIPTLWSECCSNSQTLCSDGNQHCGRECSGEDSNTYPVKCFPPGHKITGNEDGSECCDGGVLCGDDVYCNGNGFTCPKEKEVPTVTKDASWCSLQAKSGKIPICASGLYRYITNIDKCECISTGNNVKHDPRCVDDNGNLISGLKCAWVGDGWNLVDSSRVAVDCIITPTGAKVVNEDLCGIGPFSYMFCTAGRCDEGILDDPHVWGIGHGEFTSKAIYGIEKSTNQYDYISKGEVGKPVVIFVDFQVTTPGRFLFGADMNKLSSSYMSFVDTVSLTKNICALNTEEKDHVAQAVVLEKRGRYLLKFTVTPRTTGTYSASVAAVSDCFGVDGRKVMDVTGSENQIRVSPATKPTNKVTTTTIKGKTTTTLLPEKVPADFCKGKAMTCRNPTEFRSFCSGDTIVKCCKGEQLDADACTKVLTGFRPAYKGIGKCGTRGQGSPGCYPQDAEAYYGLPPASKDKPDPAQPGTGNNPGKPNEPNVEVEQKCVDECTKFTGVQCIGEDKVEVCFDLDGDGCKESETKTCTTGVCTEGTCVASGIDYKEYEGGVTDDIINQYQNDNGDSVYGYDSDLSFTEQFERFMSDYWMIVVGLILLAGIVLLGGTHYATKKR